MWHYWLLASWLFGMLEFSFMLVIPRLLESFFSLPPFPWLIKWSPLWGKTNIPYSFVVIICPTFSHSFLMKTINICRWADRAASPSSVMTLICIKTDPAHKSINQTDIALHQGPIMPAKIEYLNTGVTDNDKHQAWHHRLDLIFGVQSVQMIIWWCSSTAQTLVN